MSCYRVFIISYDILGIIIVAGEFMDFTYILLYNIILKSLNKKDTEIEFYLVLMERLCSSESPRPKNP